MSPLKILCFGRFHDEIPGGMQKHVEQLFSILSGNVEYIYLVPSRNATAATFDLHGFTVIKTASLNLDGSLALSPGLVYQTIKLHRSNKFDIIHLHFPDPMAHLASLILPKDIPRIITWHADIIRQKILLPFYRPLLNRAIEKAAAIAVATPCHIKSSPTLSKLVKKKPIHVISYGFDLMPFLTPNRKTKEIIDQFPGNRVFALGRHVYYKGFDILIEALCQLPKNTQLIIGGIGPLTEKWQELAKNKKVDSRVHFLGLIDNEELPAYYQACDVFCLPAVSPAEAFGIVQVEAMAAGKPVVSTQLNNGVDFVNQHGVTGLTVPTKDIDSLARALEKLLTNSNLRKKLGKQAQKRALKEFSLEKMGRKTLKLYQEIISN